MLKKISAKLFFDNVETLNASCMNVHKNINAHKNVFFPFTR
jgi:hypothetical protein